MGLITPRSLLGRLPKDLWFDVVELTIHCTVGLSYFVGDRVRRLLHRFARPR